MGHWKLLHCLGYKAIAPSGALETMYCYTNAVFPADLSLAGKRIKYLTGTGIIKPSGKETVSMFPANDTTFPAWLIRASINCRYCLIEGSLLRVSVLNKSILSVLKVTMLPGVSVCWRIVFFMLWYWIVVLKITNRPA